ncbi:MAG: carboxypeptidase regulatory-like domain-containing protein, partial [Acidobacteria bacterium]|nr:carboxypeptidase regulatory-like domain-containing protein [Acidobacteriota bacterium]
MGVRYKSLFPWACLASLVCAISFFGQVGSSQSTESPFGGRHFINGRVVNSDGKPIYDKITVHLSSMFGGDTIGTTDDEGKFVFTRISDGTYTVSVEETNDHGAASETVDVHLGDIPVATALYVTLRLAPKKSALKAPEVISSAAAEIPKGALSDYN